MKSPTGKIIKCNHCNKSFYVPKHRISSARYCSRACLAHGIMTQEETICDICGNRFNVIATRANKAKYCSRKCYYKAQHLKGSIIVKCFHCDKEFKTSPSRKRKYCSRSCINKSNKSEWKAVYSTVRKAMIRRGMLEKCNRCGFDSHKNILGVHHKDRNRHNNELSNLEVLCPNCHSIEHLKHICQGFRE